jgi:hypothetical protein
MAGMSHFQTPRINPDSGVESHVAGAATNVEFHRTRRFHSECLGNDLQKLRVFVQTDQVFA